MEDHVQVAGGCGHEEEEEVVVGEREEPVLVDRVQEVAPVHLGFSKEPHTSEYLCLPVAFPFVLRSLRTALTCQSSCRHSYPDQPWEYIYGFPNCKTVKLIYSG